MSLVVDKTSSSQPSVTKMLCQVSSLSSFSFVFVKWKRKLLCSSDQQEIFIESGLSVVHGV